MDGASITLMEFIHGALRKNNPNALFLIRKCENLLSNLPEKFNDKFRDKDALSRKQVQALKRQLSEMLSPEQTFSYDCSYSGLDSSSGRERVRHMRLGFDMHSKSLSRLNLMVYKNSRNERNVSSVKLFVNGIQTISMRIIPSTLVRYLFNQCGEKSVFISRRKRDECISSQQNTVLH